MEAAAIAAARSVVGQALSPLLEGIVETWAATSKLGPTISALKRELLYAHGMLNNVRGVDIRNESLEELLLELQDLAYGAGDALDELDYFCIQDKVEGTHETADRGCFRDFIRDTRHSTKAAVSKLSLCVSCCGHDEDSDDDDDLELNDEPAPEKGARCGMLLGSFCLKGRQLDTEPSQSATGDSSTDTDDESSHSDTGDSDGCLGRLVSDASNAVHSVSKGLPLCCSPPPDHNGNAVAQALDSQRPWNKLVCGATCPCKSPWKKRHVKTPKLELNRVDLSKRMKAIVEELQPLCAKVATILNLELLGSNRITVKPSTADRPKTAPLTEDPHLYGRDEEMNLILGYLEKCDKKELVVIPIVGHGGMGKTTFAQHVYEKAKQSCRFQETIWICVSASYNVNKLIRDIRDNTFEDKDENTNTSDQELIQQRLKSRRFLLVLDDIWEFHEDDWGMLLAPLRKGEARGSIVLFTTRIHHTAVKLRTSEYPIINLNGLGKEPFQNYFLACIFGQQQQGEEHKPPFNNFGIQIMDKLKGCPLAAKTVGRLLRGNISEDYWRSVLESKEWEHQKDDHDIMPALKLSYDYLPFHLQQCVAYCALFPEDYHFDRQELIQLWIGLEILHESGHNKRAEDIGHNYLNKLVMHGFFNYRWTDHYVIHDLLRDLALTITSNGCLSICYSNVRSVEVHPSVHHLSIIMNDDEDHGGGMTDRYFVIELRRLKKRLKVENLQTLIIFDKGRLEDSFVHLFKKANSLRVLHVDEMTNPVKLVLENFSQLIHLRYLRLGFPRDTEIQLPSIVSRFYHLKILDLQEWKGHYDLPSDISNLVNLHYFVADGSHHSMISMVGKLQLLRELKKFQVKRREEGFGLKELKPLMEINSLGIYNLENVLKKEEADAANLAYKNRLHKLTLHWDVSGASAAVTDVLESLRPHYNLKELYIIGHKGETCPTWLKQLNLQTLEVKNCENLSFLPPIPWTPALCYVSICRKSEKIFYTKDGSLMTIDGTGDLMLDEKLLAFHNITELEKLRLSGCKPLAEQHLQKLTSLKHLSLCELNMDEVLLSSSNGGSSAQWKLPVKRLRVIRCSVSGEGLTKLLYHFCELSDLLIWSCPNITGIGVMVAEQEQTTTAMDMPSASVVKLEDAQLQQNYPQEIEEVEEIIEEELQKFPLNKHEQQQKGLLYLPPHLGTSLKKITIGNSEEMTLEPKGGLQGLHSLVSLEIYSSSNLRSDYASSTSPFPASLKRLILNGIEGMEAMGWGRLWHFLIKAHVTELEVKGCPNFFAGLEILCEQNKEISSCKLQLLETSDWKGLFSRPVCRLLSSSFTELRVVLSHDIVTFTQEQECALELLTSLQELSFAFCDNLKAVPLCLRQPSNLQKIVIVFCPWLQLSVQMLPSSLQVLDVSRSNNDTLIEECSKFSGTHLKVILNCEVCYSAWT